MQLDRPIDHGLPVGLVPNIQMDLVGDGALTAKLGRKAFADLVLNVGDDNHGPSLGKKPGMGLADPR